eukprot:scaffold425918_cov35-Prasinocladus_malaysianus.AAC.1
MVTVVCVDDVAVVVGDDSDLALPGKEVEREVLIAIPRRDSADLDDQTDGIWPGEAALCQHGVRVVGLAMLHPCLE